MSIVKIHAREIFDSRGNPTVEVDLYTDKGRNRLWTCRLHFFIPVFMDLFVLSFCVSQGYFALLCRAARPLESMKPWSSGTRMRPVTWAKVCQETLPFKTWRIYQTSRLCSNVCNLKLLPRITCLLDSFFYISVIFPTSFLPHVKGLVSFCCLPQFFLKKCLMLSFDDAGVTTEHNIF